MSQLDDWSSQFWLRHSSFPSDFYARDFASANQRELDVADRYRVAVGEDQFSGERNRFGVVSVTGEDDKGRIGSRYGRSAVRHAVQS